MLTSKQILRNHNVAGAILLIVFAGSYIVRAFVPQEAGAALIALSAYGLLTFVAVPFFSSNVRLAKAAALVAALVSALYAAQSWGNSELSLAVLILSVPLILLSVVGLYILIFEQAPDAGA